MSELTNQLAARLNKVIAENKALCAFINREMKMTATDKRLKQLKKDILKLHKP